MQIYPAIRARMGDWTYYMVRMRMQEVASEVRLASDIWEEKTLSDAIQRALDASRVKREITKYLSRRDDRFFSSLVVAAIDGNPLWESKPVEVMGHSEAFGDAFGTLSFGSTPRYYALDGQHRLTAIKELLADPAGAPPGFRNEHVSVLIIVREDQHVADDLWLQRYRRLFSSLNRYAKPTDRDTNIIMDEDDVFAILTRRLITEHEFFRSTGGGRESFQVQTKGKNLKELSPHFTSLQTLYDMNRILLWNTERRQKYSGKAEKTFLQMRPDEGLLDAWHDELAALWSALLEAVPALRKEPRRMRCHRLPEPNPDGIRNHLLFWPIGQLLLANVARALLDAAVDEGAAANADVGTLTPLHAVPWNLHEPPWRYLLLVRSAGAGGSRKSRRIVQPVSAWRMRNEGRKEALAVAERILRWLVGLDVLDEDEYGSLQGDWRDYLIVPEGEGTDSEQMWSAVEAAKDGMNTA